MKSIFVVRNRVEALARGAVGMMGLWLIGLLVGGELAASERAGSGSARLVASGEPDWPQFRGPRRDGVSDERGLLKSWPEGGPERVWKAGELGRGFSAPIIVGERLFITGDVGEELHIFALDLQGKPVWKATNGPAWKNPYPGARASATWSAGRLYHANAHGRVACLDGETGAELWAVDLLRRFDGQNITWGLSECLLVDERAVYATAGGREGLVVALDKRSGEVLWRSEPLFDSAGEKKLENASYVSPILVEFAGRRLLAGCSLRYLYCLDADTGEMQWVRPMPTSYSVLAMMPVLVGDGIFMTAPHGRGGRLFELVAPESPGGKVGAREAWQTRLDTCQGGVVHVEGKLFGSFYPGRKGWGAVDAKTGELLYEESDFVKGALLHADERLYALSEDGWMRLIEPTEDGFAVRGEFRLAEARNDAWAHPVVHDGRMYLRYHEELFCFDVRGR